MQNAGLTELGLNWRYLAFDVPTEHLREAIQGAKSMRYIGLNLTVPHKILAIDCVDVLDETARKWGAANTIRFETKIPGGQWVSLGECDAEEVREVRSHGFNTDADAIIESLREELKLEVGGSKVLLLGAGGAGRVAALRLAEAGVEDLYLINRTVSKARELAAEIHRRSPKTRVSIDYPEDVVDLVVNATSVGLSATDGSPLEEFRFPLSRAGAVYDMIYRPAETPLLRAAKAAGCKVANGLGMLLHQGARALEIWSGKKAPTPTMRAALANEVYGASSPLTK
jgi:shikimate dehydrogenase